MSRKGVSYIVTVILVTFLVILIALVVSGKLWEYVQGFMTKRAVQVTVTVYSNGLIKVELRNVGWGVDISDVEINVEINGQTTTCDLSWSPPLPLKPGRESIGVGYINTVLAPAVPYKGTLTVYYSDGARDTLTFSGTVLGS
ncbi:MAG: hypothetical protein DRJ62_04890 [Thermoprotei archaeon]|nr:MAG: hypothetical protein DRJ62_04890 [Thermoprotei archaeon]